MLMVLTTSCGNSASRHPSIDPACAQTLRLDAAYALLDLAPTAVTFDSSQNSRNCGQTCTKARLLHQAWGSMTTFHRILVPTDFSSCSHFACDMASQLAMRFGSSIELLHVDEPPAWQGFVIPELVVSMPNEATTSLHAFVQTRTQRALEHLVEQFRRQGIAQVHHRMEAGEPASVILRVAEENPFDLIVMGTHGRKGFERLVMGSVAERVVRQAHCPVLTVRVRDEVTSQGENKAALGAT